MNIILKDMFVGWKSETLGRLKFFLYSLLLTLISALWFFFLFTGPNNGLLTLFYVLVILLNLYCGLLIMIKRCRELTRYPVIVALVLWGIQTGALQTNAPLLAALSLISLLILFFAPGRY